MIFNEHLERLMAVEIVRAFMKKHVMQAASCNARDNSSFILYRLPYILEFHDALIENYLNCVLADVSSDLLMNDGDIYHASVASGFHDRVEVKSRNYGKHPNNNIFLSFQPQKMLDLHVDLEAIDRLLPQIEIAGGLSSLRDGTFGTGGSFSDSVRSMPFGRRERLIACVDGAIRDHATSA